jgi:hypothetical protein
MSRHFIHSTLFNVSVTCEHIARWCVFVNLTKYSICKSAGIIDLPVFTKGQYITSGFCSQSSAKTGVPPLNVAFALLIFILVVYVLHQFKQSVPVWRFHYVA